MTSAATANPISPSRIRDSRVVTQTDVAPTEPNHR